jgi:hypothetical protein
MGSGSLIDRHRAPADAGCHGEISDEHVGINPFHGLLQVNTAHSFRNPVQYMETDRPGA